MSLHHKILLLIFLTFMGLILTLYLTTHHIVLDSFAWLERDYMTRDTQDAKAIICDIKDQLARTVTDWAEWDDARDFIQGAHPGFPQKNLQDSTLKNLKLSLILFLRPDGRLIHGKAMDPQTGRETAFPVEFQHFFTSSSPLLHFSNIHQSKTSILRLPQGLSIVATHPVTYGDAMTTASGILLMAHPLSADSLKSWNKSTINGQLEIRELSAAERASAEQTSTTQAARPPRISISELGPDRIVSRIQLQDLQGHPVAELTLEQSRTLYMHGRGLLAYFVLFLMLIALVFSILMTIAIKKLFLDRLTRMNARLHRISAQRDTTARLKLRGQDEMATLGAAINQMLDSLVKADDDLLQLNDNLESMVSARTIDLALANEALRKEIAERERAEQALNLAHQRKDEFLAMLAHELRNPLAPIRTITRLLQQTDSGDRGRRRRLEVIDRQVAHMSRLLDDLLDVSRITQGKIELRRDRVDLRQVLDNAMETMRGLIQEYGHSVEYERPGEALWLDGDPTRLEQVFNNLINNAVKYTEGAGTIRIGVAEETAPDREGKWAVIRVRDSGIGIDAGVLPHIFDLFVQADRSLDRTRGGLGLGLTLVNRLVRMHGGTVEARSEGLGKGSEFAVRLPLFATAPGGQALPPAEFAAPALAEEPHDPTGDGAGCKVLVAEDNLDTASSMAELLEVWGYQVRVAYDGPMAIEMAAIFAPEIVLLDIGLPHVNGYEVARRLREAGAHTEMTIVALTGYSQDEDRKMANQAGCDYFLAKPVDLNALRAVLDRARKPQATEALEPTGGVASPELNGTAKA